MYILLFETYSLQMQLIFWTLSVAFLKQIEWRFQKSGYAWKTSIYTKNMLKIRECIELLLSTSRGELPKLDSFSFWYSGSQMTKNPRILNRECQSTYYYGNLFKKSSDVKTNCRYFI